MLKKLNVERVLIDIDPDSGDYEMNMSGCSMSRLIWVLGDIRKKLINQNLGNGVKITDLDGVELTKEEATKILDEAQETLEDIEDN